MHRRAAALTQRLRKYIARRSRLADVGSGTGHNAHLWRTTLEVTVAEFDVADLHWVGSGPILYDGERLPAADAGFDVVTLLFVLQYPPDPLRLLREARRICLGRVLVMQSTYQGGWGRLCLDFRELIWGRFAFHISRLVRAIPEQPCPLRPQTALTREELRRLFEEAGFCIQTWEPQAWWGMNVSRDLYVLETRF